MNPNKRRPSLLERAAEVYDFSEALRARSAIPLEDPAHAAASPAPKPVPVPVAGSVEPPVAPFTHRPVEPGDVGDLSRIPPEFLASNDTDDFVPPAETDVATIDRGMLAEHGMIVPGAPVGPLAEEFRLVKRQLLVTRRRVEAVDPEKARTVLVCSARPRDGKTFSAVNLALSMAAERDTEVLLVDADVAKPDVQRRLGLPQGGSGLLDALADASLDPETLVVRTDVPGLSILPPGAKSASDTELLASERTGTVIARLLAAEPRRLIIFDSPPALAASPAGVLAMLVGQVMLVVRADRTPESEIAEAADLLDGCEHIQLVLNGTSFVPNAHRFGSYYGLEDSN